MKTDPPVLFLDIDGVLNCRSTPGSSSRRLDPTMVARLVRVLRSSNCNVVISSTWRAGGVPYVVRALAAVGFPPALTNRFIGVTPWTVGSEIRGQQIGAWLIQHPRVRTFAIVDDDADMGPLGKRLVKTSFERGLTDDDADALIALLTQTDQDSRLVRSRP